jgi:hypothetical protein
MNSNRLPGIKDLHKVRCSDLQKNIMLESMAGIIVPIVAETTKINFVGEPKLSWESSMTNGAYQEKATLEFDTEEPVSDLDRCAIIATAVNGGQYIIGTYEPKYPIVTYSETTGTVGSKSVRSYKITHVAVKCVLECIL